MLIDSKTRVIVQGITGTHGSFHAARMLEYGTNIVAGVTPGKGGTVVSAGEKDVPVYNAISEAAEAVGGADYSIIFVPAMHAFNAAIEALHANLNLVIITEHIPVHQVMKIMWEAGRRNLVVIGPNCPGLISPGECKIGIMPGEVFTSGSVGVLSRSGTLTYEIVAGLSKSGIGQSTVVGIGGDMINGLNFVEGLKMMEEDPATEKILLIGEIGGDAEERAAAYIADNVKKPVFAYLAGRTAPVGKTMGHAGAIISHGKGGFAEKKAALEGAGVKVASMPGEVVGLMG